MSRTALIKCIQALAAGPSCQRSLRIVRLIRFTQPKAAA
jgi:hypothetical protein